MIFDNTLTDGSAITATTWNRAWGYNGTAKSLYDLVGGQQSANQIYSTSSWIRAQQQITQQSIVEFSFASTYTSSWRAGDLVVWKNGFAVANNLRDSIPILRNGFYIIQAEVGINDNVNRIGSSTNTNGIDGVPDIGAKMFLRFHDQPNSGIFFDEYNTFSAYKIANTIQSGTAASPAFLQPYYSLYFNTMQYLNTRNTVQLIVEMDGYPARENKITHASLKIFLIRAV